MGCMDCDEAPRWRGFFVGGDVNLRENEVRFRMAMTPKKPANNVRGNIMHNGYASSRGEFHKKPIQLLF